MKIAAFVLLLSLVANLSFANLTDSMTSFRQGHERLDTVSRDGLSINLLGDWNNIGESQDQLAFSTLSIYANGKFSGTDATGKKVCGNWEISNDSMTLVLHKICEKSGLNTETVIAKIELLDGHMLALDLPTEKGGKQLFIQ
jgi:hypothetical protein